VTQTHVDTAKTIESQKVEAITMLAAGVAHELGNPLNSLNIHLQLLARCLDRVAAHRPPGAKRRTAAGRTSKRGKATPSADADVTAARELLQVAGQEVARLDAIVHHFLRAVRPVPPDMRPLDLPKLLGEVLAFMRVEIENRKIAVEASWPDTLPSVTGDRDQLRQAFYNIIRNAVQAMNGGGRLDILCREDSNFVSIRFQDTGAGIAPQNLSRIMEPYFTTHAEGSGLGLLIVNRIVRTHGGELLISSVPGEGAAFTIRLPLRERQVRLLEAAESVQSASIPTNVESRDTGG
jgi:signal transduction histidine kinase